MFSLLQDVLYRLPNENPEVQGFYKDERSGQFGSMPLAQYEKRDKLAHSTASDW